MPKSITTETGVSVAGGGRASERPTGTVLAVHDLEVVYDDVVPVLHGASIEVPRGAIVALLGANGAGKTTLLRAITGLLEVHRGKIRKGSVELEGRRIDGQGAARIVRRGIAQVMEGRRIFAELTVEENLRAGAFTRRSRAEARQARERVLALLPALADRRGSTAGYLSGGEQQMLAIARALMSDPRVLVLDEPSLGLAPRLVELVGEIVVAIREQGTSVLLVEQNAAMALSIADHGYVLEAGRVVHAGSAAELREDPEIRSFYLGTQQQERPGQETPEESAAPPLLEVRDLALSFGGVTALDGLSFDVRRGELLALIGPNGAGKTSLLNCINGVYRPQRGSIRLDEAELVGRASAEIAGLGVARTFQTPGLFGHLTLVDNLMLGRHRLMRTGFGSAAVWWGRARRETIRHRAEAERVIELLELERHRSTPVGLLPYGVQKRVELGRALSMEPRLLLLDEPVAGMSWAERDEIAHYLLQARRALDVATVLVAHEMTFVMGLADRVLALDFGCQLAIGAPAEVQQDERVIQAYLGGAA